MLKWKKDERKTCLKNQFEELSSVVQRDQHDIDNVNRLTICPCSGWEEGAGDCLHLSVLNNLLHERNIFRNSPTSNLKLRNNVLNSLIRFFFQPMCQRHKKMNNQGDTMIKEAVRKKLYIFILILIENITYLWVSFFICLKMKTFQMFHILQ